jgi:hypothetical protein
MILSLKLSIVLKTVLTPSPRDVPRCPSQRFRKLEAEGATFGAFNVTASKAWHERQQRQDLGRIERYEVQFLGLSWFQVLDMTF